MSVVNVAAHQDSRGVWGFRHLSQIPSNPNQLRAFIAFDKGVKSVGRRPIDFVLPDLISFDEFEAPISARSRSRF